MLHKLESYLVHLSFLSCAHVNYLVYLAKTLFLHKIIILVWTRYWLSSTRLLPFTQNMIKLWKILHAHDHLSCGDQLLRCAQKLVMYLVQLSFLFCAHRFSILCICAQDKPCLNKIQDLLAQDEHGHSRWMSRFHKIMKLRTQDKENSLRGN